MPDSEAKEAEVTIEMTNDKGEKVELTEEAVEQMLNDAISVKEVTLSVGETRQLHEYQPNNYHLSFRTSIEGVQNVIDMVGEEGTKVVKKLFLSLLMAKLAGQVASMKRFIHAEMLKDGFNPNSIDWRKGERAKVTGE